MSSNFLVFHTSGGILLRPAAGFNKIPPEVWKTRKFSAFSFFIAMSSSSPINCPSLVCSWPSVIFFYRFISDFSGVFKQILEMFFSLLYFFLLDWQLPFTSFNHGCISSSEFLILFIWPWMYSICSFWYVPSGLKFLCMGNCWISFIKFGCFFFVILFFFNCYNLYVWLLVCLVCTQWLFLYEQW